MNETPEKRHPHDDGAVRESKAIIRITAGGAARLATTETVMQRKVLRDCKLRGRWHIWVLLALLLIGSPSSAQSLPSRNSPITILPFQLVVNHFYVEGSLNNSPPLSILIDSGAPNVLLSRHRSDELGLQSLGPIMLPGFGGAEPTTAHISEITRIDLAGITLEKVTSYAVSLAFFDELVGHETDAVLGSDLFNKYVVELDYLEGIVRLYDPATYSNPGEGCQLPLTLGTYSTVHAQIVDTDGQSVDAVLMLDTGSNYSIITKAFGDSHPNLALHGKTNAAPTRRGLSGTTRFRVGRIRAIKLGSCTVDHPIVAFSEDTHGPGAGEGNYEGIMGTSVFQQFTTIFDYQHHLVTFKRNASPDGPLQYDMTGIHLLASGPGFHEFTVDQVMVDSPAKRKGIQVGDKIESVNRVPSSQLTVDDLEKIFRRAGALRLTLRRDGKKLKATLKLTPTI